MAKIDEYKPASGRMLKEDSTTENIADALAAIQAASEAIQTATDGLNSAIDDVNGLLKVGEQSPGYEQGDAWDFGTDVTITKNTALTLPGVFDASTIKQYVPAIKVKSSSAGQNVSVTFRFLHSIDDGTTWGYICDSAGNPIILTLANDATTYVGKTGIPIPVTSGWVGIEATEIANLVNAVVCCRGGQNPG